MSRSPEPRKGTDPDNARAQKEQGNYLYRKLARNWVEQITGDVLVGEFGIALKDGQVLCKLINTIKPGSVRKIETAALPFKQMENISNYLKACRTVGMIEHEIFETVDLFEAKDIGRVISHLHALSRTIKTTVPGFGGPFIDLNAAQEIADSALPPTPERGRSTSPNPARLYFRSLSKSPSRGASRSPSTSPVNDPSGRVKTRPSKGFSPIAPPSSEPVAVTAGGQGTESRSKSVPESNRQTGQTSPSNDLATAIDKSTLKQRVSSRSPVMRSSSRSPVPVAAGASLGKRGAPKEITVAALMAQEQAQEWIQAITDDVFSPLPFAEKLKSGVTLCNLINAIKPGSVERINKLATPFMQMENISAFLRACRSMGVPEHDLFETCDLYEERDVEGVVRGLFALARTIQATVPGFTGPHLGPSAASAATGAAAPVTITGDTLLLQEQAQEWIQAVTGDVFAPQTFQAKLSSGVTLCNLINIIKPGSVKRVNTPSTAFAKMENISSFLSACKAIGVPPHDLFETVDLLDGRDLAAVVRGLFSLGKTVQVTVPEFTGPVLGPKRVLPHNGLW